MEFQFSSKTAFIRFGKYVVVYVLFTLLLVRLGKPDAFDLDPYIFVGVLLIFAIPILLMFIQYLFNDWNAAFKFEKSNNLICFTKNGKGQTFTLDQITSIELCCTPGKARKGGISFLWQDDFFYYKFAFQSGELFVVTSLTLKNKLINPINFKGLPYNRKLMFFAFL